MQRLCLILGALLSVVTVGLQLITPRVVPPLHLPPAQEVVTRNPKIGAHTRLTGTTDEQALTDQFGAMREMGARWVTDLFPWAYIQPQSPAAWDWRGADLMIAHAQQQGLEVIARLDIVPAWARPPHTSDRLLVPERFGDYARFAAAFADRYPTVRYLVVWNEPNLHFEWGNRVPDPEGYAALLKAVYPAVKRANPQAHVVAGGLSPGQTIPDVRLDDLQFLQRVVKAGGPFDAWAVHAYGGHSPADEEPHPDRVNFRRVEVYRDQLQGLHYARPLLVTEGGWNDHPRWHGAVKPSERLQWTVDAYRLSSAWPDVVAVCMWQWQMPTTHSYGDNYTFVAPDGTPKAIYWAVQRYARSQ